MMAFIRSANNSPDNYHKNDHTEHNCTDDYYEVNNFLFQWGEASLGSVGHLGDLAEHGSIAS